jgi:hypothetical protein
VTRSIVSQLARKDARLIRTPALLWWLGGLVSVALMALGPFMLGMILFVTCLGGAGFHIAVQTTVEERREGTRPFLMSLPVSPGQYAQAKIVANLAVFGPLWLTLSGASMIVFSPGGMDRGALPFVVVVLVAIFVAFAIVLATSLIIGHIGAAIGAIVGSNIATQIFLWWLVDLESVQAVIEGDVVVWNATLVTTLAGQILAVVALLGAAWLLQSRRRDCL